MMGKTHAISGAVMWLGLATLASDHVHPISAATIATGLLPAAGGAILPDLDHERGTAANSLGPISRVICKGIAAISGGHRKATHSLLGTAVAVTLAAMATGHVATRTLVLWLCIGLGVRAMWQPYKRRPGKGSAARRKNKLIALAGPANVIGALAIAYGIAITSNPAMVPWAVAVGYLAHLMGDSMTEQGIPWLWPIRTRFRVGSIDTGGSVELKVVVPALYAAGVITLIYALNAWTPMLGTDVLAK